jgi:seryl-tRNA(Sec) selenium transferase
VLISITHRDLTANQIEMNLRGAALPVIARIIDDRVLLDLRTVAENEEPDLEQAILSLHA